jgi:hypothetical protein
LQERTGKAVLRFRRKSAQRLDGVFQKPGHDFII